MAVPKSKRSKSKNKQRRSLQITLFKNKVNNFFFSGLIAAKTKLSKYRLLINK